jgi:hypothetical protein
VTRRAFAVLLAAWPGLAVAGSIEPTPRAADLRIKRLPAPVPATLVMRRVATVAAVDAEEGEVESGAAELELTGDYRAIPSDLRDLEERVVFHVNLGYGIAAAPASGDLDRTGFAPGDVTDPAGRTFTEDRQYLLGDAVLGSRGILLPSLSTYFLSQFKYDIDGASSFGSLPDVYDTRGGRAILVRAGYAEIAGIGPADSPLSRLFLRGGRQFRYGTSAFVANFDGAAVGYRDERVDVSGFFGRRVSLFFDDDPGLLGGGGLVVRGRETFGLPIDVAADYLNYAGGELDSARQLVELGVRAREAGPIDRISVRGRVVDIGDGFALGRIGMLVGVPIGAGLPRLTGEATYRTADDFAYDFVGATASDVVAAPTQLGIALEPPSDSVLLGARADWRVTAEIEVYLFGRANLGVDQPRRHTEQAWSEGGAAASWVDGSLSASVQGKLRRALLEEESNEPGSAFDDTAGSGVSGFAEVAGDARYRIAQVSASAALGGYYRVYDVTTPYAEVETDGRGGGRAEVDYRPGKYLRLKAAGEVAQPSPTFARELDTLVSLRLVLEAIF